MGGAPLFLALAVVTVDYGWESDGRDGYRYIVQIPAEQLHDIERTGKITSRLPPELRGRVSSIEVRVGDGEVPRPAVTPVAESPATDSPAEDSPAQESQEAQTPHVAAAGTEFPGPEETVRGQGEASQFGYPSEADDAPSTAASNSPAGDSASSPPANAFGTSDFGGFSMPRSTTTATSNRQDAPSTSRPQSAPSTSRADGAPSASGANSASDSPASGFATDSRQTNSTRDNRWSSDPPGARRATASQGGTAANDESDPPSLSDRSTQQSATNPSASENTAASSPFGSSSSSSAARGDAAAGASASEPAGGATVGDTARQPQATYPPSSANSPSATNTTSPPTTPPASSSPPSTRGNASEYHLTPEARQRLADQQLLAEVGVDDDGFPYVKSTGMPLRQTDPWYPAWVDYANRMHRAEAEARATRLATPRPINGNRPFNTASSPSDPYEYGSQWDSPEPYQPAVTRQPPADDRRVAQRTAESTSTPKPKAAAEDEDEGDSRDNGLRRDSEASSPSDFGATGRDTGSRPRSVAAQPLFNFLLLLSLIGNVYLGIAISRLIRRYRNLVSTQRGSVG